MRLAAVLLSFALTAAFAVACDTSLQVGKLKPVEPAPPPDPGFTPVTTPDAGATKMEWRLRSPAVPCTIYAMDETRTGIVYLGCESGRIYKYDGVKASVAFDSGDEASIFSLLWTSPSGEVWAGAVSSKKADATTQLYHFDGTSWSKLGDASKRFTSLAGYGNDVFVTTDTQIFHYEGGAFAPVYTATAGTFRACAFVAPKEGYCVGTERLSVAWNGTSFSPALANAPWSADAELFGVEYESLSHTTTFFYGEPLAADDGNHTCRIARLSGSTFGTNAASIPCFSTPIIPHKRTGQVTIGFRTFMLLVPDDLGGSFAFNLEDDTVRALCPPSLAFSRGSSTTRTAGVGGFMATLVGAGGDQFGFETSDDSYMVFNDLSVAPDGTAWARIEDRKACGTVSDRIVRFDDEHWTPIAASAGASSGRGLSALTHDLVYTADVFRDTLLAYDSGTWNEGPTLLDHVNALFAAKRDDVWIGGIQEDFGHTDGKTFTEIHAAGRQRQVEQILGIGDEVWMMQWGTGENDTAQHIIRWANGKLTDWSGGIMTASSRMRLAALDEQHVYRTGSPAMMWNGSEWRSLNFDAGGAWVRAADEVYFIDGGDIWRWDGHERTLVYHGFVSIWHIGGSKDRGFAVGPGGLTVEFAEWPAGAEH